LLLASALGCGRVEQRVVDEEDTTTSGATTQAGRGGSPSVGGAASGGMGGVASTAARGGGGGIIEPNCGGAPNPLPLQALSNFEYARSVEAVVDVTTTEPFPPASLYGYPFSYGLELSEANVGVLYELAETYGSAAQSSLRAPCATDSIAPECAAGIVEALVGRAFRRNRAEDLARYLELFYVGANDGGWDGGLELVTEGALLSPFFLFKWYAGESTEAATERLTPLELASRLSYFVTGGPPDRDLVAAAENDLLGDESLEPVARHLLAGPRFRSQAQHFYDQWLGLYQLDNLAGPELSLDLLKSVRAQTDGFIDQVFQTDRSWPRLLLGDSPDWQDPNAASGLLTARSTLMRWNNPTRRGQFVRERLLCTLVPPPPPGVPMLPPEPNAGQTRREQWIEHRNNPVCAACHQMMDPIGFGLENFDEVGLYRNTDNGLPVDASGEFVSAGDADGPFVGPDELKLRLANSSIAAECQAATWLSFALQRSPDPADECFARQAYAAFAKSNFDVGELIVSIALTKQFRSRDRYQGARSSAAPPAPKLPSNVVGKAARRKVLLDFVIAETEWFATAVSPEDRPIVEQYLNGLRTQQAHLGNIQ
jgi:hypothetical protein